MFALTTKFRKRHVLRAPVAIAHTAEDLEHLFPAARARGNEGLMIKDLDSLYTPGAAANRGSR